MLMSHTFASYQFDTMYRIPAYQAWLDRRISRTVPDAQTLLQHLQWRCPGERWVLKAPNHLFALPALAETYPDVGLIWTHRSPADVIPSLSSLYTELRRVFSDSVNPKVTGPEGHPRLGRRPCAGIGGPRPGGRARQPRLPRSLHASRR